MMIFVGADADDIFTGGNDNDFLLGLAGNDRLFGNSGNNFLFGGHDEDILIGSFGNDILVGGDGDDFIVGAGIASPDTTGPQSIGRGEIDTLIGGEGKDTFVLRGGSGRLGGPVAHYTSGGIGDYALITDFNPEEDIIRLTGIQGGGFSAPQSLNYVLSASPEGLPYGTGLYIEKSEPQNNELIAILQGFSPEYLSIVEPYFQLT